MKNYFKIYRDKLVEKIVQKYNNKKYREYFGELKTDGYWSDGKNHYYSHLTPVEVVYETLKLRIKRIDLCRIHGIRVLFLENRIEVIITTGRPGLIIGRGGETISAINKDLDEVFHAKVNIELKEEKTFKVYYW